MGLTRLQGHSPPRALPDKGHGILKEKQYLAHSETPLIRQALQKKTLQRETGEKKTDKGPSPQQSSSQLIMTG